MKTILLLTALSVTGVSEAIGGVESDASLAEAVNFNSDIQPIFSDVCFACHGPDENQHVSDLRLDTKQGALAELGGSRAIVPGDLEKSELYRRITASDADERMPPSDSGRSLSDAQILLLKTWIQQGAAWEEHWAFIAPTPPTRPITANVSWRKNGIDDFVLARLEREGLRQSSEADESKLIRRVSLDLTGLPPTLEEVEAFLADDSSEAYERVVDRLLLSTRYGERMAMEWLDAARYADTSGYQTDGPRYMWRWRDWVIQAFNENMRYDQFTIEQIAGDLLTQPGEGTPENISPQIAWRGDVIRDPVRLKRLIASGFHRNHRGNAEGGIIPEEYQVEYVVDRVETTATVWLGLTVGCSRCHNHKYDPIKQEEFYRLFAFFNNIPERGMAIKLGNSPPFIKAPTTTELQRLDKLDAEFAAAEAKAEQSNRELRIAQASWEKRVDTENLADATITDGLLSYFPLDGNLADAADDQRVGRFAQVGGAFAQGQHDQAAQFDGACFIDAGDIAKFGFFDKFTLSAWIFPENDTGTIISRMLPEAQAKGYYVHLENGRLQVNLVARWLDDSLRVETERALSTNQWHHISVTYDGSRVVDGIKIYIDGQVEPLRINQPYINQTFLTEEPLRIGGGNGNFAGAIDDVRVYQRDLSAAEASVIGIRESIPEIVLTPIDERTPAQQHKLQRYFIGEYAPPSIRRAHKQLERAGRARRDFLEDLPTVMVMQEVPGLRETRVLKRGQYDQPGKKVLPGVPAIFPPLPADAPSDRRGLAQWLVDPSNPLTARVAVNRYWQMIFGNGLVTTTEDFGSQGQRPSHPQLLDWLATEFVRTGWNVKAMLKLMVMSATYRQSSKMTPESLARDPENRLLARGPRIRLPAELVRDQALFVSGLLTEKLGGPSVFPYQPEGLWREIASETEYNQSHGVDLYRRSLYTFWKRTVAPPTMVILDATAREACTVKRSRTNTPLQALVLMNEVAFFEAARALGQRAMLRGGDDLHSRLRFAFRLATAREPNPREIDVLTHSFEYYAGEFRHSPESAEKLLSTGEYARDEQLDVADLASYTMVASLILNLDELMTKE